jgi:hypothetical protein
LKKTEKLLPAHFFCFNPEIFSAFNLNPKLSRELYAAVPGIRKSLLGVHAKRFGEQYHHLQRRRSASQSLNQSTNSLDNSLEKVRIEASDEDDEGK